MGQVLHGSATTTEAIRRAIQLSQESLRGLAKRYGLNPKTVAKWKKRSSVSDFPTGPRVRKSSVFLAEEEAIIVAFRRHTLLPLDDCLYALRPTIPHLTRSSLHRCLLRHGIGRLPEIGGDKPAKKKFKPYPIGFFHINIAEVRTEQETLSFCVHRPHIEVCISLVAAVLVAFLDGGAPDASMTGSFVGACGLARARTGTPLLIDRMLVWWGAQSNAFPLRRASNVMVRSTCARWRSHFSGCGFARQLSATC